MRIINKIKLSNAKQTPTYFGGYCFGFLWANKCFFFRLGRIFLLEDLRVSSHGCNLYLILAKIKVKCIKTCEYLKLFNDCGKTLLTNKSLCCIVS